MNNMLAITSSILVTILHVLVLTLVSVRAAQIPPSSRHGFSARLPQISTTFIRGAGLLSAISLAIIPYVFPDKALLQSGLRCACFFYACKILDLSFAKAAQPPQLLSANHDEHKTQCPRPIQSSLDVFTYTYYLATEMRFPSFDTAVKQSGRPSSGEDGLSDGWFWIPPIAIPILTYLFPTPEIKCLLVLLIIQVGLETLHTVCHYNRSACTQPLFYKPFAASSFSSFWASHWHAAAAPFLQTLAYQPGKRYVGKWFGVLAAFNLTGLWHAWAAAPVVEPEYAFELGFKVWAMFMIMGVGILAERAIWGERQEGLVQRLVVWLIAILSAGWACRTLERHSRIPLLRVERQTT